MKTRALCAIAVVVASLTGGCRASPSPATTVAADTLATAPAVTTAPVPSSTSAATTRASTQDSAAPVADGAAEECDSFTIALDRLVFIRLQPIIEEAADLLNRAPEDVDPSEVATGLMEASRQLLGLVDELDLMGVPPREVVDLLLSIREGILAYADGFDEGSRGWASGDAESIAAARADVLEASAVLTEFFGWQLCP